MKYLLLSISVLWLAIQWSSGHSLSKIELKQQPADIYRVQEDKDGSTLTISNPKPKKPTLREIIYYHIIEKAYSGSSEPDQSSAGTDELDVRVGSGTVDNKITFPDEGPNEVVTTTVSSSENEDANSRRKREVSTSGSKTTTTTVRPVRFTDKPQSASEVSSSEDALPKSRRKREVTTSDKAGVSKRAKKRTNGRKHHQRHSSTVKPIPNKTEESKRVKRMLPIFWNRNPGYKENGNQYLSSEESNSKGDETITDDLSDNDSRLSNENYNIVSSNESNDDSEKPNNDDKWNLSDNDSKVWNDDNNNDSNQSNEDKLDDDFNQSGDLNFSGNNDNSADVSNGSGDSGVHDGDLIEKKSGEYDSTETEDDSNESNNDDNASYDSGGNISIQIDQNGNWPDYGNWYDEYNNWDYSAENGGYEPDYRGDDTAGRPDYSSEGSDYSSERPDYSSEEPVENGDNGQIDSNVHSNVDDKTAISQKFDQILADLHDIFVKGNATVVLPLKVSQTDGSVNILEMLHDMFSDIKNNTKRPTTGVIIKSGDPNNPNHINVLEGMFTNIIQNDIIINTNEPAKNPEIDGLKIVSQTTESNINKEPTTNLDLDSAFTSNPTEYLTETTQDQNHITAEASENPDETTPYDFMINQNKDPTEAFTSSPINNNNYDNNEHDKSSQEENANKTEKPTSVEVTEKSKNDDNDHHKPETNKIDQDTDKTDDNEFNENEVYVTNKPNNNDEIKKPVEDHSKDPDDKKSSNEENKCTAESNKDTKNPEGDNNTKLDYMLDLMNNEKFWTFVGTLAEKSLESLTERTTKYIKEEIAAQISKYFEEHKLVEATEAPTLDPHKIQLPENKPQTDNKDAKNENHDGVSETDINNNEVNYTTEQNLDIPIENTTEDPAWEEISESKKRVPKNPVHVEATNIYGNTVGNDKVTNVYVFYASKNLDEIMKNIKHLINGNNSTNIIYNFGSHESGLGHNNDDNKGNPEDVTETTTEEVNNENKVTTESNFEIEVPVTNEYDRHVNTESNPGSEVTISKEHDTTEPNKVTEGVYDSGETAETEGTTESESQDIDQTTPTINDGGNLHSNDPDRSEGGDNFSVTDEPVTDANHDGNDENNSIQVTTESESNQDDVTDSTNGIYVEGDGTGTDSTNESDDNNATTSIVDETNGNDEADNKIESTTESHINDVTDSTIDEVTTQSNNDEQGGNASNDGVNGSQEISSTTFKVDEIVTNGADEESDNKIDNITEPESHNDEITDSTIDIITTESNIDGQGDNPSIDSVHGSDEISSTTFKIDEIVPTKDDEETDNKIDNITEPELHNDEITDSTIDITTTESTIDGQGDNPSIDSVHGSDEISSTTFKVDEIVPNKDDEESNNNIESTTESEPLKDVTDFTGGEVSNESGEHINGNEDERITTEPNVIGIDGTTSKIDESTVNEDNTVSTETDINETDNAVTTHKNDVDDEDHKINDENSSVTESHNNNDGNENNSSSDGESNIPTTGEPENDVTEPNKNDSDESATENIVNDETTVSADIVTANITDVFTTEETTAAEQNENNSGAQNSENDKNDVTEKTEDGEISTGHDVSEEENLENNDIAKDKIESSEIDQATTEKADNSELDQLVADSIFADTKETSAEKSTENKKESAENSSEQTKGSGETTEKAISLEKPFEKSGESNDITSF